MGRVWLFVGIKKGKIRSWVKVGMVRSMGLERLVVDGKD